MPAKLPKKTPRPTPATFVTVSMTARGLREDFERHLRYTLAKDRPHATDRDRYEALARSVRDRLVERWIQTQRTYQRQNVKRVYYLSVEFLLGRLLGNNVINLQIEGQCRQALSALGLDWNALRDYETDAGLGNGGLGRLAACFLDSMATLGLPGMGYGLFYDYGIFKQRIVDGAQVEEPDRWLKDGYPWALTRREYSYEVPFGGHVEIAPQDEGAAFRWTAATSVIGIAHDVPIIGYGGGTVNTLRLWSARAADEFDLEDFNRGSYVDAVENKVQAENLTKVLYPNDAITEGKELRLKQQYFFVCCSLQDILRRFVQENGRAWHKLPDKVFLQLNDTHPALAIPELMRLLIDRERLPWDTAWELTRACMGYTNHTVLPEALEHWGIPLFERLLPRHLHIIYEINTRFLAEVAARHPGDTARLGRVSLIGEGAEKQVRMANLAVVGSCSVNGVAELHSRILRERLFRDFAELWPERFSNKTNGITQRRWLLKANPGLAALITRAIGPGWITNLDELRGLEAFLDDEAFLMRFGAVKQANKKALASLILSETGVAVSPESIFDVQVKRLHEYKRQLLLALYVVVLYNRLLANPKMDIHPRTFILAAKAAPGYTMAKRIIRFLHAVAGVVNGSPAMGGKLKVVFLPDYRVSLAERIIPAANLSEQISLAGTEASGTGNMKLMLNGALTIGTLDGATIEIRDEAGEENLFLFGMTAEEAEKRRPSYDSRRTAAADPEIHAALERIRHNAFSPLQPGQFDPILRSLLEEGDHYMLLADLRSYMEAQERVDALYRRPMEWNRMALINVARAGKFSSDRTIRQYASEIWKVTPCAVEETKGAS
ncbi:MAG: glycogen/starch/alpha-glucan phosphorylase [Kiritimatiellia bacterium]